MTQNKKTQSKKPQSKKVFPTPCTHPNPIPIEYRFGTVTYSEPGNPFEMFIDWSRGFEPKTQRLRVTKLWCPQCKKEISLCLPRKYYE